MKTSGSTLYYSTLTNEVAAQTGKTPTTQKEAQPSRSLSPRRRIESASSSISSAVATSVISARKITVRARSFVPKTLCTPVNLSRNKLADVDEITPVIYYPDKDTIINSVVEDSTTLVDPFSFEDSDSSPDKEDGKESNSPTSVIPVRLFPDDFTTSDLASVAAAMNRKEEEDMFEDVVTFDCPIFTQDFKINEEDSSVEFSEAIKSINAVSIKDETRSYLESIRNKKKAGGESLGAWQDHSISWDGFTTSESFNTCEWDPKSDLSR